MSQKQATNLLKYECKKVCDFGSVLWAILAFQTVGESSVFRAVLNLYFVTPKIARKAAR